ncbi:5-dehydro-4-deoxy-D-glucuronate isomerase [uncultured Algoriphagus sp.]|uniref:5-dehydro-4-deoxy-D-glucuronate isomerase n=1 Tax=uncultured Algoriphagus sp. TaxID=417365 RepID=UPI0030EE7A07|tara:strand:- start:151692 stop:152537 length:846 start_codon:yes stop_codon:yes gene_type:complete
MQNQSYFIQHAVSPREFKSMDTDQLRESFLMENLFIEDQINMNYTHYDRMIVGGVVPISKDLTLETITPLKSDYFLERRELGIINIGKTGEVIADGVSYTLENKEALYLGRGTKSVTFKSGNSTDQPIFYFNSAPAHTTYPSKKISEQEAEKVVIGSLETSNHRKIRKLIVNSVVKTCQLQMGLTELKEGSVWNTLPAHTHDRRMEAYLYFDLPEDQMVCHFIGEPQQTRHIWMKNQQAVLSPPWSIHSGAGTSNYTFIWGMAGENLDYGDMDVVAPSELR